MAQHDMNIANQGFPAFRADLNNALAALVSNSSGATEPTTMFAHQLWVDTAANPSVLKIRNADNDAWITVGTIDQTGDTFTLTSAVSATTLNTSGQVVFNDAGADVDFRVEGDTDANLLFVDASTDRVGIGTNAPGSIFELKAATPLFGINGTTANSARGITFQQDGTRYGSLTLNTNSGEMALSSGENGNGFFLTFKTDTGAEKARITSGGDLLVGTTSLSARLTINSSGTTSATNALNVRDSSSNSLLAVRSDGYITCPPTYSTFTVASAANLFINADGGLYRSTSSLKYKKDIKNATYGLFDLLKLRPVTYKGKSEVDGNTIYGGLIAEEVDAAGLTEFVQYAKDGTPDALAYGNMVSLCIKAIQELKAELDTVKAELATLKGQ